jgi:hypothetical protein
MFTAARAVVVLGIWQHPGLVLRGCSYDFRNDGLWYVDTCNAVRQHGMTRRMCHLHSF